MDDGTGQFILKTSVRSGVLALQQAQRSQNAGCGADGGDLLAGLRKGGAGLSDGLVGGEVGRTRDTARKNDHVDIGIINLFGNSVGGQMDLVAADDLLPAHGGGYDDLDLGAAEQVNDQQRLALFGAVGKKYNCFAHLDSSSLLFSSRMRRRTLSSLPITRLTRLMMALDAPMFPMMLV